MTGVPTTTDRGSNEPALTGRRVVDLSTGIGGAYCTKLLVDGGADVVLVEPPGGHPLRRRTMPHRTLAPGEDAPLFHVLGAGKQSVLPADEQGVLGEIDVRALPPHVEDLVATADVVVVDRPPPDAAGPALAARYPGLVVVSLSPFGLTGPWSDRPATDLTLQALSSSITGRGERDGSPVAAGGELTAWAAGATAAVATLVALRRRDLSGLGEHIDLSELEVAITIFNGFRAVSGQMVPAGPPPYQVVEVPSIEPARDGWVGFTTLSGDQFRAFATMIERPEWADDPEISRIDVRIARAAEVRAGIAAWTTEHTVEGILEEAAARRIPVAPIGNGAVTPQLPHLVEREVFQPHPGAPFAQPRIPYRFGRTPQPPLRRAPRLGSTGTGLDAGTTAATWAGARSGPAPRPAATDPDVLADLPLRGIRVFDLTSFWAGPYVSQILGFFGAEVVKVESAQRPDGTRMATSYGIRGDQVWERAPLFQAVNTGKRGVTLDLSRPEGQALGRRLLSHCDVLIENYSPRVAERFGLVDTERDDLITVRMPAWGLTGPWRDLPGFAQTMEQASGLAWVTGFADGPPLIPRGPCDPIGALHGAFATLAAVLERDRTGLGQVVEVPLVEAALNVAVEQFAEYGASGAVLGRHGNAHPSAAPHGVYRTVDGWVAIAVVDDGQWLRLRDALGQPGWSDGVELDRAEDRVSRRQQLDDGLAHWCAERTSDGVVALLWPVGVPAAPLVPPHEVVSLAQAESRGFFEPVDHPLVGTLRLPSFPARLASRRVPYHAGHAPLLGQDNRSILGTWLGLSDDDLDALEEDGIIGTRPV